MGISRGNVMSDKNSMSFAIVTGIAMGAVVVIAEELWTTLSKKPRSSVDSVDKRSNAPRHNQR